MSEKCECGHLFTEHDDDGGDPDVLECLVCECENFYPEDTDD